MRTTKTFSARALAAGTLLALALASSDAPAVGTRSFVLSSMDELKGGDLKGVSIDSQGSVRAGLTFGSAPVTEATSVWDSVLLADGSVLLGTGNDGKLIRVQNGQPKLAAKTDALAISSLVVGFGGNVYAGSFPDGKIFEVPPSGGTGGDAKLFVKLDAEDVWDMAFDEKNKALYVATGPTGKLFRVDQGGKASVYFDSEEPHLMSVAVAPDGSVYTGASSKGLLYKVTGPGRASVVHDFEQDEVRRIEVGTKGELWVAANALSEPSAPMRRNKTSPSAPTAPRPRPGKGTLYRIVKDANPEKMLYESEGHFISLAIGDDGLPYVGTTGEGRIHSVDDNLVSRIVVDADEKQIASIVMAGKKKYFVAGDPVVLHEIKGSGGADAVWTSKVLDAGLRAQWGRLSWRAEGSVDFETRSGSTATPDATWSAWQGGLAAPGDVKSPPGRYVQVRARFKDPKAVLREVSLSFLTDNVRAVVTSIDASSRLNKPGLKTGIQASGGEAPKAQSSIALSWRTDNPDQDELRYRLSFRLDGETTWRQLGKPTDKLTRTSFDWDVSSLPEGAYRVRVEVSDELSNPAERALKHQLDSGVVLVDMTPPVFKSLSMAGRRVKGELVDGLGPISRIEVAVAGTEEWRPIHPSDGVFDEASEPFDADVSSFVPAGSTLVAIRAWDGAGNMVARTIESK